MMFDELTPELNFLLFWIVELSVDRLPFSMNSVFDSNDV